MCDKKYFAAANSGKGFVSFFEDAFFGETIEHRYIIKGGPGTGKSSLMRRWGASAEAEGKSVEYFYCSSDTDSLDGILIDGKVAVFDGTAPHSYDTRLPGALDEIINLGSFWNAELLISHKGEIAELGRQKSRAYEAAYGYLGAALGARKTFERTLEDCTLTDKLSTSASRLLSGCAKKKTQGVRSVRQTEAFGKAGAVRLDTLERAASRCVYIEDYYGTAYLLLAALEEKARALGADTAVSFDTLDVTHIRELYLPESGEWFGVIPDGAEQKGKTVVKMKRFVRRERLSAVRPTVRCARAATDRLIDLAAEQLRRASEIHAQIEKYYVIAMDFELMKGNTRERA